MALIFRLSEIYFVNKYRNNINVEKYEKDILNTKNYFVLKHIRIALSRLDSVERKAFDKKYIKYLGEFIN